MQSQLVVGDSFNLLNTYVDYPASAGWTLKTTFTPRSASATKFTLTAIAEGNNYRTTALPATTAAWIAGDYHVAQWVEKAGQRVTVGEGAITLLPDPSQITAGSTRAVI